MRIPPVCARKNDTSFLNKINIRRAMPFEKGESGGNNAWSSNFFDVQFIAC
jgi:hypothetical protein